MEHSSDSTTGFERSRHAPTTERIRDLTVIVCTCPFWTPSIALVALLIRALDGKPVIYRQVRVGQFGRPFTLLKFRTMRVGSSPGRALAMLNDTRVTRLGRVLRATHLDELPQLFNVIRGEMSLIGPRPEIPEFVTPTDSQWRRILLVRPGLFDEASLACSNESQRLDASRDWLECYRAEILPEKLRLSLVGIEARSLHNDFVLFWRLILHVAATTFALIKDKAS